MLQVSYVWFEEIEKEILIANKEISKQEQHLKEEQTQYEQSIAAFNALKKECDSLANAGEGKERLGNSLDKALAKQDKLQAIFKSFKDWHELSDELENLQQEYKQAADTSKEANQIYEIKNQAFLDEQAGIIAEALQDGMPCPVCGSSEHPCTAKKSESAPTEAQLKKAKEVAEKASKETEEKSGQCKTAKAMLDAKAVELGKLIKELWPDFSIETAEDILPDEQMSVAADINELKEAMEIEENRVARRDELAQIIPKTEMMMKKTEQEISMRATRMESQKAALGKKKKRRDSEKSSLRETLINSDFHLSRQPNPV